MPEPEAVTEETNTPPGNAIGEIGLIPLDNLGAIAQVNIGGIVTCQIVIPPVFVKAFVKGYLEKVKLNQDIMRAIKQTRLH